MAESSKKIPSTYVQGVQTIHIGPDEAGQRLDNFLFCLLKQVPKTHIYRLIRKGEVRVNKKRQDASYRLLTEDLLRLPPIKLTTTPIVATAAPATQQWL